MKPLIYDTETTGFPIFKEPSEGPNQPHIVELAALLYDDSGHLIDKMHRIVRPDGWVIPDEAAEIHKITTERAMDEGVPEHEVIAEFHALQQRADLRAAHNETFDQRIMRIGFKRFGDGRPTYLVMTQEEKDAVAEAFKLRPAYCTAKASTKACNLPPTEKMIAKNMRFPKTPTMAEAYFHYTQEKLEGAHNALVDALACARVYFLIQGVGA